MHFPTGQPLRPAVPSVEALFSIDGLITEVLPGCGAAIVEVPGQAGDFSIHRGTAGIDFDKLKVGQRVHCDIGASSDRVIHAHQQTQPIVVSRKV